MINLINSYSQTFEQTYVIQWQISNTNIPPFHIQKYTFNANLHFIDRIFFYYQNHQDEYVAMRQNQIPVLSVLLFILSLNLFSLHNNVLKNRRQEIAIKRALGFSKKEIVMEFLLEGTIIFLINLLIISFIIFSIGVLWHYKNYQLIRGVYPVSIMIYPFSLKIFLVSSIFLTILNSVVLAFLATRINIIDAIKTE